VARGAVGEYNLRHLEKETWRERGERKKVKRGPIDISRK